MWQQEAATFGPEKEYQGLGGDEMEAASIYFYFGLYIVY